jgi:precorrin-2 dehydrogenase/sirohydrochlorin ferrochelatase
MEATAPQLYPVALDVRGKKCVVIGGGAVGTRKALALQEAGAIVIVVSPEVSTDLPDGVIHHASSFTPAELDGAFLAIAATDNPAVNAAVAAAARERGVLLNLAASAGETEDSGDFVTMATVRRGELLLALTTGGAGPALSARLKRELETQFGPEWGEYVALLREMRGEAYRRCGEDAPAALRQLAARDDVRMKIAQGETAAARKEAFACLSR